MLTDMEENYLLRLPDEILIKILKYLDTHDIFEYCEAYPEHIYFLSETETIRELNFCKSYASNILTLLKKVDADCVTVLNINAVYWCSPQELRNSIKKFHNLECLYILDTKLSINPVDCQFLCTLQKLQKLAICAHKQDFNACFVNLPLVRSLMIHFIDATWKSTTMFVDLRSLDDLWIIDRKQSTFTNYFPMDNSNCNLSRYVFQSYAPLHVSYRKFSDMQLIYENRASGYIYFEKQPNKVQINPTIYDEYFIKFWEIWSSLHCCTPYGVFDGKRLTLNDPSFYFEELNFCQQQITCCDRYAQAVQYCLNSRTARKLKKLSFKLCHLEERENMEDMNNETNKFSVDSDQIESKRRKFVCNYTSPLNKLDTLFPYLRELEIWKGCHDSGENHLQFNYDSISHLCHLEKLTLCIFRTTPTKFICDVFKNCKKLTSFRLYTNNNEPFMITMGGALKFAHNLKDLRCESSNINVTRILEGLNKNESSKLERLLIKGKTMGQFEKSTLSVFLTKNKQLVFFCVILAEVPYNVLNLMNSEMRKIKTSRQQIFLAMKDDDHLKIPDVHRFEMLQFRTAISVCDIYNDFLR